MSLCWCTAACEVADSTAASHVAGCDDRIRRQALRGVQVHVGWLEGGTAVFAFRGTASKQDGLQDVKIFSRNIDYLQELYPGVKAHLGMGNKLETDNPVIKSQTV